MVQRWCFGSRNGVLGCSWTKCEIADLKQSQRITPMDHRNKTQALSLPPYDPGDALDCITEYGPCTCKYGHIWHTAPTARKYGVYIKPKLHLACLVWPKPPTWMPTANMANSAYPTGRKKRSENKKCDFLGKSAKKKFMRGTANRHVFLHIGAHLVTRGVLRHTGADPCK